MLNHQPRASKSPCRGTGCTCFWSRPRIVLIGSVGPGATWIRPRLQADFRWETSPNDVPSMRSCCFLFLMIDYWVVGISYRQFNVNLIKWDWGVFLVSTLDHKKTYMYHLWRLWSMIQGRKFSISRSSVLWNGIASSVTNGRPKFHGISKFEREETCVGDNLQDMNASAYVYVYLYLYYGHFCAVIPWILSTTVWLVLLCLAHRYIEASSLHFVSDS